MAQLDAALRLADVYAAALFELAREKDQVEHVRGELDELVKLLNTQPEFAAFLESAGIGAERREAGLERMLRGRVSDLVLNTLLVMNRHGRAGLLAALHRRFVLRQEQAAGEVEGVAISAVELSPEQRGEVQRLAAVLSGKKPLLKFEVDPQVVGGLVLRIGDMLWDDSIRTKLETARQALHERAERGFTSAAAG